MNHQNKFPIYRDANRLLVAIENAVKQFPRYHKYTLGSEMRNNAYALLTAITYSINNKDTRKLSIKKAHNFTEALKIKISLAKQITNLSFKIFETLTSLAISVAKQCKAWQKQMQHQHQNGGNYV